MRFDDRLLTVLNQPAGDRHDVAVRWRQLVDLVARAGSNSGSPDSRRRRSNRSAPNAPKVDEGSARRGRASGCGLPAAARPSRIFRVGRARRFRRRCSPPPRWSRRSGGDRLRSPTRRRAASSRRFIPRASEHRLALDDRRRDRSLRSSRAPVREQVADARQLTEPARRAAARLRFSEVVERIERRRRSRAARTAAAPHRRARPPSLFRWECGPGGEIAWVDGAPRGALIGRSIARARTAMATGSTRTWSAHSRSAHRSATPR